MNQRNLLIGLALMLGVALWNPVAILAAEHGGKEHGGTEPAAQEPGGAKAEGSHAHKATLLEAAAALRATRPDLATQLEEIAAEEE